MSLHISITTEAERELSLQKRKNTIIAITAAMLTASLLGLLLYTVTIIIEAVTDKTELFTHYVPTDEDRPPNHTPVTPERITNKPSASHTDLPSIITTIAPSAYTTVATIDPTDIPPMVEMTQSTELGVNFGGDVGTDLGTEGGEFGYDKPSGSALEGTFYDFKQTKNFRDTGLDPNAVAQILKDFINKGWNENLFSKYYKSPTKLYASHIYISNRPATEAPKAYKCADKVKDSRWAAIYRGNVLAPKSGKFRFVGVGDDCIAVRFNGKNVFDYGWFQLGLGKITASAPYIAALKGQGDKALQKEIKDGGINIPPVTLYTYSSIPGWNNFMGGLAAGQTFTVEAGKKYPIEILITELPGGAFGAVLLIEEVGVKAEKKDKTGSPILPIFRTNYGLPDPQQNKGEIPPFEPVSPIWEVAK